MDIFIPLIYTMWEKPNNLPDDRVRGALIKWVKPKSMQRDKRHGFSYIDR
jgi:hypothetical protein